MKKTSKLNYSSSQDSTASSGSPKTPKKFHDSVPVLDDDKISSVVKIFTTAKEADYASPWSTPGIAEFSGTGFVIDGKRIVTNGHVVANQVFMKVQIAGDSKKYTAELKNHADHCDLAIITVNDDEFWDKAKVCSLGDLPTLRAPIQVYGFPIGGSELSITEGIISRIDFDQYAHSEEECLVVQVDAAINPGNSGGPVFSGGKVIGIVHQGIDGGQNLGYFIPVSLLKNVLDQIEALGDFKGLVDFNIQTQPLENKYIRKAHNLIDSDQGLLITHLEKSNPLSKFLKRSDVLLEVDGKSLTNDGSVSRFGSNLSYKHLFHEKKPGDLVSIKIKRGTEYLRMNIPVQSTIGQNKIVTPVRYNEKPTYIVFGGIVFTPLTTNYIRDSYGGFFDSTPAHLKSYEKMSISEDLKQIVLMSSLLTNAETEGYSNGDDRVIKKVEYDIRHKGKLERKTEKLKDIFHLAEILSQENIESFLFHLDNMCIIAIDKLSWKKNQEVLDLFDIPKDRSDDIRALYPGYFSHKPESAEAKRAETLEIALLEQSKDITEDHLSGESLGSEDSESDEEDRSEMKKLLTKAPHLFSMPKLARTTDSNVEPSRRKRSCSILGESEELDLTEEKKTTSTNTSKQKRRRLKEKSL